MSFSTGNLNGDVPSTGTGRCTSRAYSSQAAASQGS